MSEDIKKTENEAEEVVETETPEVVEEADEVTTLQTKITELNEQVNILKNEYAKAYADTENTRKRLQADFDSRTKFMMKNFALELLPVLDSCERALAQATSDEAYRKGVEMIYGQLQNALSKEGITEIDALNKPFDGNWHQALMTEARENVEPGTVIEVLQKGYRIKDRLLRAAMVKVSE
ncbi:MAG: nucleotide exchange factor GrpE [Solobacterium sp.]|nr:nucleotide exchange factor GrpE [Solobacterium sp.]